MRVALLIATYNRPEYLRQCLWSLQRADLSKVSQICIVDDASTDKETKKIISEYLTKYHLHDGPLSYAGKLIVNQNNIGIKGSLLAGYDFLFNSMGREIIINLDSDAIVRPDFIEILLDRYINNGIRGELLTGFHSTTKNANGTDRHHIIEERVDLYAKKSVGGINFCIDKEAYENFVKPSLQSVGNWDHNACIMASGAYSLKQSVIQHIGFDSSMGHHEQPDIADDFYYWDLPTVTLIGADNQPGRLKQAADKCTKWVKFGAISLLNPPIYSKEQYSEWCIKEMHKHIPTEHALIIQYDGFVNNWQAWDNDWLQYDYIGAPWYYKDGMAVGNGGFSLRSRKLMEIIATDPVITQHHPEDHHICRTYRFYLEATYGIKFAPLEVAEKFSFEGYKQPNKVLSNQFGVHGSNPRKKPSNIQKERYVFNQFRGLGDILFLIPLYRALIDEGNTIMWPIVPEYMSIAKHFPDVNFVNKDKYPLLPYESRQIVQTLFGKMLPYRFSIENMGLPMTKCMEAKYTMYGHDHNMWRELTWCRDRDNERRLSQVLNLPEKYILVNPYYGEAARGCEIQPIINSDLPIICMKHLEGFSLIDWLGVIEGASEVHVANSSINYLIELMDLNMPVYMYRRNLWGEREFEHTRALWVNKCWRFV